MKQRQKAPAPFAVFPPGIKLAGDGSEYAPIRLVAEPGLYAALKLVYRMACQHPERHDGKADDAINVAGKFIEGLHVQKGGEA